MTYSAKQYASEALYTEGGRIHPGWQSAFASMICLTTSPAVLAPICFGIFTPYFKDAFGWTEGHIGWGIAVMSISIMLGSLLSGPLIDRFGVRRLILVCIPLFGLAFACMGLQSGALWQYYLAWIIVPAFGIGLWPGSWAKATAGWFNARLGLAVAVAMLGVGLGATLVPLIIRYLATEYSWRIAYMGIGLGSILLTFPLAYFFVHEAPADKTQTVADTPVERLSWRIFQDSRMVCLTVGFLALGWFSAQVIANLVPILIGNGVAREVAIFTMSGIGLGTMFGRVLCGWLLDRLPFHIIVPAFCVSAACAAFALLSGVSGGPVYVVVFVVGMMLGAEMDILGYAVQRLYGRARFATLFGLIYALFHLGGALGGLIMGQLHDATGGYTMGLTSSIAACIIAAIAFGLIPFGPRTSASIGASANA